MKLLLRVLTLLSAACFAVACSSDQSGFVGGGGMGGGVGPLPNESVLIHPIEIGANLTDLQVNGAGTILVYASNEDPLGTNPARGEQIFSITVGSTLPVQITRDTGTGFFAISDFDLTDDGTQIVFLSNQNLTGNNPNNATNVFLATTDGSSIAQLTSLGSGAAVNPRISGDGSVIVFTSRNDLTGGNPLNASQIFSINADGSNLTQVTTGSTAAAAIVFADDGSRIAWEDNSDPFGTNADGNIEIFAININGTNHMQLTMSTGNSKSPRISDDGAFIAFTSAAEFTPGSNPDAKAEVYVVRSDGTGMARITDQTDQPSGDSFNGAPGLDISGNGEWIVFGSRSDILGLNPDRSYTIYWARADGSQVQQLLREETKPLGVTSRFATFPLMNNSGNMIYFNGLAQYSTGAPANGNKIFRHVRE